MLPLEHFEATVRPITAADDGFADEPAPRARRGFRVYRGRLEALCVIGHRAGSSGHDLIALLSRQVGDGSQHNVRRRHDVDVAVL